MSTLRDQLALSPEHLRRRLDPATLPFASTAEVPPLEGTIGQPRALDAIEFGLDVHNSGFNLYVAGNPGSGRETTMRDYLQRYAATRPVPPDWVYVHDFADPDRPQAIQLPAGKGVGFARDMEEFVDGAQRAIPRAFDSDDYERRRREALGELSQQRDAIFEQLQAFAHARSFTLEATPAGIVSVPVVRGKPLASEDFDKLPDETKQELERLDREIQTQVSTGLRQARQLEKEAADRLRGVDREVALFAVGPLLDDVREHFRDQPRVLAWIDAVQNDIPEHLADFHPAPAEQPGMPPGMTGPGAAPDLGRYRVNVLIDNAQATGAPVVVERNPSFYNLNGRIDYRVTFGAMVTDFRQIKPGGLHRANGGFLVLHVLDVLRNPFAWDALKRALISREVQIENLGEQLTALPTARLRPEPIPIDIKVVLIGPLDVYHLLYQLDEDFQELFKVKADFSPDMDWSDEHVHSYAAFISRRVGEAGLHHFDPGAVARVVEEGARLREDQRKLSTRLLDIANLVTESSYWAGKAGHDLVRAEDVEQAISKKEYRSNLVEERLREMIADGTIAIETDGERVGRVNGLSVLDLGDHAFGQPSRVTARVSLGRGAIRSIEREIELSGPIHSKGFLILTGYLAAQYAQDAPLAVSATITFEQSYGGVDGDSASSTELYALLSALADVPLDQGVAVTGSVDQYGDVQAVGGVTDKIEGFFAVCKARGLNGRQGVMIPATNVPTLMLRGEIVDAVRAGQFHVWAVRSIDEGIELLTGRPAGVRGADGTFPEGTVHRLVHERITAYAEALKSFGAQAEAGAAHADGASTAPAPRTT
ncbi:MAG TPA: AAA family ATPase [Thermomicrobiaceae bacterium]|nr:AAA family ATPase [Thermomicrobiaceae bacterium]